MKLTVLMPVYNGAHYLREAIDSILNQSYSDFEFLIVDDGSTDNSVQIIRSYDDSRINLVENRINLKLVQTLNKGIELSKGEYIARFDCDDMCHPERLELQLNFLEKNKDIGLCGCWCERFGESNNQDRKPISSSDIKIQLLFDSAFCHGSIMVRKHLLLEAELKYDLAMLHVEDYDLFSRCSKHMLMHNLPIFLYKLRISKHSTTGSLSTDLRIIPRMIIQQREIENLCIPNDIQKTIHYKISHPHLYRKSITKKDLQIAEDWLRYLLTLNKSLKFYDLITFESVLSKKWFQLCYFSTHLGVVSYLTWIRSPLSSKLQFDVFSMKFITKSVFKRY